LEFQNNHLTDFEFMKEKKSSKSAIDKLKDE